jgi:hypothetical protein
MEPLIVVLVIAAVVIALFVFALKATRGGLIESMNEQGLTTKSGKFYAWSDLERIEFNVMKHRVSDQKKVQAVHFYFKTGKASAGYIMKNIASVIQKANELQVPKSERVVGMYVR